MTASLVTLEESDRAVMARLARPEKCNAISLEVIGELESLVQSLLRTGSSKPFVLRGSGRWFASGGDLRQFVTFTSEEATAMAQRMADLLRDIERLPGPTIAALNGPAIGGGVELALAFDMRAASSSSYLRFAQTRIGITTGWQGIERLGRLVGYSTCLYLMLTGSQVPADDALNMGLVNAVWPDETLTPNWTISCSRCYRRAPQASPSSVCCVGAQSGRRSRLVISSKGCFDFSGTDLSG